MRNMNKPALYLAIITLGILLYLFPKLNALYFFIFLVGLTCFFIAKSKKNSPQDKKFLITLIILIFISRFLLSLFVMNVRGGELTQDEGLYSKKALIVMCRIKGTGKDSLQFAEYFTDGDLTNDGYGFNIYTYILGSFYYLFGYQIQAARFVNIYIGILLFVLIFYLTKELFNTKAARISSAIYAFFPSMVLWSVMIGADMLVSLGIAAYILSLVKIIKRFAFKWLIVMITAAFVIDSIRLYAMFALILVTLLAILAKLVTKFSKKGKLTFLAISFVLVVMLVNSPVIPLAEAIFKDNIWRVMEVQMAFAVADEGGYFVYPDHSYKTRQCNAKELFGAYSKGMYYVLFSPFPWRIESNLQLMAYPQVICWYFMIPFTLYGFYIGYKREKLATISIFLYSLILFSIFALVWGNVGALFRHKDMVTPFLIIYFSAGVYNLFCTPRQNSLRRKNVEG